MTSTEGKAIIIAIMIATATVVKHVERDGLHRSTQVSVQFSKYFVHVSWPYSQFAPREGTRVQILR
jgi:hypothetical protein